MENRQILVANAVLINEVKKSLNAGHSAKIRVKGHSMRLFLKNDRDSVLLSPISPEQLKLYDVVLAEVAPSFWVLHRIIHIAGDNLSLMGDGNVGIVEHCTRQQVIGKVTAFYRKGRLTPESVEDLKWKIYSRIWLLVAPLRRYILGVVRRLPFDI